MPVSLSNLLLTFQLGDRLAAFPLEDVERIAPMAELASPPGLPSALEGVLDLAGVAVPVLRLDRLFQLPAQRLSLYSMLVILRVVHSGTDPDKRIAVLVDRVTEMFQVPEEGLMPLGGDDSFNGCSEGTVMIRDQAVSVLSPARIMLAKERRVLLEFQDMAQQRLQAWKAGIA